MSAEPSSLGSREPSHGRRLPQSLEAEVAVLGAMLLDATAIGRAIESKLREEDFVPVAHRVIFRAMLRLYDRRQAVDPVTLKEELRRTADLERAGGDAYLAEVIGSVPTTANVEHHARIVLENATKRKLISVGTQIVSDAYERGDDADVLLDDAEKRIFEIAERRLREGFAHIGRYLHGTIELLENLQTNPDQVTGVPSGFDDLDAITAGFQLSDLVILAARPSVGKTSFAINVALHAAIKRQIPVAIFSLEMSTEQVVQRVISCEASVDSKKMRTGRLSQRDDWPQIIRACDRLQNAKVFIDDTPALSVLEMRAKARRLKSEIDLGLIILDYLQLMEVGQGLRVENRQQEITIISRQLKALAKELNVPVLALSQLSRAVEQRSGPPRLSDLRESGSIEQDADLVVFLYPREEGKDGADKNLVEVSVAKHRNGPVGELTLVFDRSVTRFRNLSKRAEFVA